MTFDEAEDACRQVAILGEKLLESSSPEDAKALEQKCRRYMRQMDRTRYGYVSEKLVGVMTAAKLYQKKSRMDVAEAKSALYTALRKVERAMIPLRNADRSQWQE